MIYILQYRAHLPPRFTNLLSGGFNVWRSYANFGVSYRALAYGTVQTETDSIPAGFLFEYDTSPFLKSDNDEYISFLKEIFNERDFHIPDPRWRVFVFQPIAYYGAGFFFDSVHKTPGFAGLDVFFSTVPPAEEGKPWWGEYYDPVVEHLYNPPPEVAFAEDERSYLYTQNFQDPRVVCPALIPSHLWDKLRFFIRFFDTVYIFKPTEYARRRYYRLVEDEFPGWMRKLQGLSWLQEVDIPKDAINLPYTGAGAFFTASLGENIGVWVKSEGEGREVSAGDEILSTPSYYPAALQSATHAAHLSRGRWRYSPNSGYWPPPDPPTWWDVGGFSVVKVGPSLLHYLTYLRYDGTEEEWWDATLKDGAQTRVFAEFTTGYRDNQGNWIMPPLVGAESPLLVWHGTSGDFILGNIDTEDVDAENKTIVDLCGQEVYEGNYGGIEYKVIHALTAVVRISISSFKRIKEGAKVYAPPDPAQMAKALHPWMELVDVASFPYRKFLMKHKRKLHYKPEDMNRHVRDIRAPTTLVTSGGTEKLGGVSFHVATLPTGESSNVTAWSTDPNKSLGANSFVDNLSWEYEETDVGDSIRPWVDANLLPTVEKGLSYLREAFRKRGYVGKVGVNHDMVCWQIKTLKGSPRDDLPLTLTSKKEIITLGEYARKVGFAVTAPLKDEYKDKFKVFGRLHGFIPIGAFAVRGGDDIDLKAFINTYKTPEEMAKFPIEKSPKLVMWIGAKVSPPELQFIPSYRVLVSPAVGLMWEFAGRAAPIRERRTVVWAKLLEGASGDKEFYGYLGAQLKLLSVVDCDFAAFYYHALRDAYYIERYAQPIILSAPLGAELATADVDINIFKDGVQLVHTPSEKSLWLKDLDLNFAHRILTALLSDKPLKDIEDDAELRSILERLEVAVANTLGRIVDGKVILISLLTGVFPFPPTVLGKQVDLLPFLLGLRFNVRNTGFDKIPTKLDLSALANVEFSVVDLDKKEAIHVIGMQTLKREIVRDDSASQAQVVEEVIKVSERMVAKALQIINPLTLSNSPYIAMINRLVADENRLRNSLFIVGDERADDVTSLRINFANFATVLCPHLTVAPFIFPNIPDRESLQLHYPLSDKDIYTLSALVDGVVAKNTPALEKVNYALRVHLSPHFSPRYSWSISGWSGGQGMQTIRAYPIPPHHLPSDRAKVYPYFDYALQPLPLWLLRCYYTPQDTFLASIRATSKSEKVKELPTLLQSYTTTWYAAPSDVNVTLQHKTLYDLAIVRKFRDGEDLLPVVLSIPDESAEGGERLKVLFYPDLQDDAFWDSLHNDGRGYFIPTYRYEREKDRVKDWAVCDVRGYNREYQHLPHISPFAPEEMWVDGVRKLQLEEWDDEKECSFYRLRYEHPTHWRVYLSIYTIAPNLPSLFGVINDDKLEFLHAEYEPFNYFILVRGVNPFAEGDTDKVLFSRKFVEKWAELLSSDGGGREKKVFQAYWNKFRDPQTNQMLHTLQVFHDRFISKINEMTSALREVLLNDLELVNSDYPEWESEDERIKVLQLVEKQVANWDGGDYAAFCAYYAPATPLPKGEKWDAWWKGDVLSYKDRVPAALLVLPKPFAKFFANNLLQSGWTNLDDIVVSIASPHLWGRSAHFFTELDIFSLYPHLRLQVLRWAVRDIISQANSDAANVVAPLALYLPKVFNLNGLKDNPSWSPLRDKIDALISFFSNLAWGEIFTSAFLPQLYVPSFIEIMEGFYTTTALFVHLHSTDDVGNLPFEALHWRELGGAPALKERIKHISPRLAWARAAQLAAKENKQLPSTLSAKLAMHRFGLSFHYNGIPLHPSVWLDKVKDKSVLQAMIQQDSSLLVEIYKVIEKDGGKIVMPYPLWTAWGGCCGGFSAPSPPQGIGGLLTKQFCTYRTAFTGAIRDMLFPFIPINFQTALYAVNEIKQKSKGIHLHLDFAFHLDGETDDSKKIVGGITPPLGDSKFNPLFSLFYLLAAKADSAWGETWAPRLLFPLLYYTYYPYPNENGAILRPIRVYFLGANRNAAIVNTARVVPITCCPVFATEAGGYIFGVDEHNFIAAVPITSEFMHQVNTVRSITESNKSQWSWWWGGTEDVNIDTLWLGVEISTEALLSHVLPLHPFVQSIFVPAPPLKSTDKLFSLGIEMEPITFWGTIVATHADANLPPAFVPFLPHVAFALQTFDESETSLLPPNLELLFYPQSLSRGTVFNALIDAPSIFQSNVSFCVVTSILHFNILHHLLKMQRRD